MALTRVPVPALPLTGGTLTGALTISQGTLASNTGALTITATLSSAAFNFQGLRYNLTRTTSSFAGEFLGYYINGTMTFRVGEGGDVWGQAFLSQAEECDMRASGLRLGTSSPISFTNGGFRYNTIDAAIRRAAAGVLAIDTGTAGTYAGLIAASLRVAPTSANGQNTAVRCLTELTTIAAAATTDTTIQLPAGAIILSVSARVTVAIPTAATFMLGDAGNAARYGTSAMISTSANTTDVGTAAGAYYNATAQSVRITPLTTPATNAGRVRITITYIDVTVPTS